MKKTLLVLLLLSSLDANALDPFAVPGLNSSGQVTVTVPTGTAPLVVNSNVPVANLSIGGNSATTSQTNFINLTIGNSQVFDVTNFNTYAPTLTGTGASGTWGISVSGNAATATNATNVNGGSVNGSTGTFLGTVTAPQAVIGVITNDGSTAIQGKSLSITCGGDNSTNLCAGFQALYSNTTGINNVAEGFEALYSNTTGYNNAATGLQALYSNTIGYNNAATGFRALYSNTTGINNVAEGFEAGYTATTSNANVSGSNDTWVGFQSGPGVTAQLNNSTAIGNGALNTQSNQVVLGNTAVTETVINGGKLALSTDDIQTGQAPVAITVGASPFAYTVPYGGEVAIGGGTVTQITLTRGGTVFWTSTVANGVVPVRAGDIVTVTYTTAPTEYFAAN